MEWYFDRGHLGGNSFKCVSLTNMKEEIKSALQSQSLDGSQNTNQANLCISYFMREDAA